MTIRPGHATKKSQGAAAKSSTKGLDVVKMNEFESRHYPNKNRSYSPFSPMGSPTTPLNFEQLFLQAQLPMGSSGELPTHHDHHHQQQQQQQQQGMVQVQLMHSIRDSGLATKAQQAQNFLMLEHFRQGYNRGGEQEEAEWNARALAAAAQHHQQEKHQQQQQQQQQPQPLPNDISTPLHNEPSSIALLQQRFTQLERHKAELQKSGQVMDVQLYPSQWPSSSSAQPTTTQSCSPLQQSCGSLQQLPESRHYTSNNAGCFYPLPLQQQQPQPQQMFASGLPDHGAHEMFFPAKKESPSWKPTQLNSNPPPPPPTTTPTPTPPTITRSSAPTPPLQTNWAPNPEMQGVHAYMYFPQQQQIQQQQIQHRQPKGGEFRNTFIGGGGLEFGGGAKHQHQFSSSNLGPSAQVSPDMRMLSSVVVSSRCDKTGGHSVEIKSGPEQYCSSDESEMSLDNFSGRLSTQMQGSPVASNAAATQIAFNNFQLLPQSNKSAFSTFTRPGQYISSSGSQECGVTTRSLLFNDTYSSKRTQEPLEMHDDIDTTLHL